MASEYEDAMAALRAADAAGDTEAAQRLAAIADQFKTTPGGAATGNPNLAAQGQRALTPAAAVIEPIAKIGGAGGIGAAIGAAAPELLTGAAGAAAAFPMTARVAPLLSSMATAARGAGRAVGAISGGVSGLTSETAGQMAEAAGAPGIVAEGARLAGGLGAEGANLAKTVLEKYALVPALGLASKFKHEAAKALLEKLKAGGSITQSEEELIKTLTAELRGGQKSDAPLMDVYGGLKSGAEKTVSDAERQAAGIVAGGEQKATGEAARITALSQQQADQVMADAQTALQKTMMDAQGGVDKRLNALPRIKQIGDKALETARNQRAALGADRELSDIGTDIRGIVTSRQGESQAMRRSQYAADEAARDAIVAQKEGSNQFIETLPEYKQLVARLRFELTPGKHSPEVARNFENILNGITVKAEEGGPLNNVSFQAVDDVRRRLGEVFRGQPVEGFDAISANMRREYYRALSDLQKKFAGGEGGPQERLLDNYARSSGELEQFLSKRAQKATAVDRFDESKFGTDAAALPTQFFKTAQGVKDLIELTGNKAAVAQSAGEFAANALRDKTEAGVRSWMTANRDWLAALPEVRTSVENYANALAKGEGLSKRAESAYGIVHGAAGKIRGGADTTFAQVLDAAERKGRSITGAGALEADRAAAAIRTQAERDAGRVTTNAGQVSDALLGNKYEVARVKDLILSGDRKTWELAAPAIASDPAAKAAIFDATKQVLADRVTKSAKGVGELYSDTIRVPLERSGLITKAQADGLAEQLARIENMKAPAENKLGFAQRMLLNTIAGYASSATSRGGSSLVDQIPR